MTIPKVFHSVWVGGPLPDHLAAYLATWRAVHPDWEHRVWGEADLRWLANVDLFDRAEELSPSPGQFRADLARYEILHRWGGVYVDCDFEARKPLDPLLDGVACAAAWETQGVWINNALVAAEPGHPLLTTLVDCLPARVEARPGCRPNIVTGPQYLTPLALAHGITLWPAASFYPYRWDQLHMGEEPFPDAYAVHHWDNRRRRTGHHRSLRA